MNCLLHTRPIGRMDDVENHHYDKPALVINSP